MRPFLTLLFALAVVSPTLAQETGEPEWVGVWQGKIGPYPIVACLDTWDGKVGRGSYYYRRYLRPIAVRQDGDRSEWYEYSLGWEKGARWRFDTANERTITGEWSSGERRLPITLEAMEWQNPETPYLPCEARAFIEPRLEGGEVVIEAGDTNGIAFMKHEYRNPEHLDVSVAGFSIFEGQPGDAAINEAVSQYVPTGTVEDDWVECLSGALAAHGTDGYFERLATPSMLDDAFVTARIRTSLYCGGAHPSHWTEHRVFDRDSGEQIDFHDWFGAEAVSENPYGSKELTEAFRKLITDNWGGDDPQCASEAVHHSYWDLELQQGGIAFIPSLPHVMSACAESTMLDWDTLESWLSDAGKAGLARLDRPVG